MFIVLLDKRETHFVSAHLLWIRCETLHDVAGLPFPICGHAYLVRVSFHPRPA
jgi:hypothetical protein